MSRRGPQAFVAGLLLVWGLSVPSGSKAAPRDAKAAFETVKSLVGRWEGTTSFQGTPGVVEIRLTAGGSVVVETEFPGSDHEMMSLYYLDGDRLVRKHHCILGNQPEMTLDLSRSTPEKLVFAFSGGTDLDAAQDDHIHDGQITLVGNDRLESTWAYFSQGEKKGENAFFLTRVNE